MSLVARLPGVEADRSVFEVVVCGVDGSEAAEEAVRQATRLLADGGRIVAVTWERRGDGVRAIRASALRRVETRHEHTGDAVTAVLDEARRSGATLVAVGSHGSGSAGRTPVLGRVAEAILHEAPCSVLVARPPVVPARFPRSVVVGVDGSDDADRAFELVARELAVRFDVPVRTVVAADPGALPDLCGLRERYSRLELLHDSPVRALVRASQEADLLVVGSRGLHGSRRTGSVSERVAHRALCSVLVVR
jgi:nucleotide-binding universal stress UspA family protein